MQPDIALDSALASLQIEASSAQLEQLNLFLDELLRWNRRINLTAVRDRDEALIKHILDSAAALPYCEDGPLLDVGSGAGLPGIVLAILRPELEVVSLDSRQKRISFQDHIVRRLSLPNLHTVCSRVEDHAGAYPRIISRAFAAVPEFCALVSGLVADGGRLLAMQGRAPTEATQTLAPGWQVVTIDRLTIPGLPDERHMIVLERAAESASREGA